MKIVISPAKSLDFESKAQTSRYTVPVFEKESELLVSKLKKLNAKKIGELMKLSPALSDLNFQRYQEWSLPFTQENSKQALLSFTGQVYQGINAKEMSDEDLDFAQNNLRILSGLYGVLKPLDWMQPYRLEMGTKFAVDTKTKNLYAFWKENVTNFLNEELKGQALINLASNEYFKAVDTKKLTSEIITPIFKDNKNGDYKVIMTFAKLARGYMTNYIIKNKITNPEDLKGFDYEGYVFNNQLSSGNEWIFTRG